MAATPAYAVVVDDDLDTERGLPGVAWLVIGVRALIGVFTIVGWVFSLVWSLVRLVVVVALVVGVVYAVRAFRRS